ncbi:MAG: hypothetical protein M1834_002684 [Cirrosporium novae-zelandiae]|nr:MAG: hypothetical protein M1834_002684 [Cirrosporium novae-zelandiae]
MSDLEKSSPSSTTEEGEMKEVLTSVSHARLILDRDLIIPEILHCSWSGNGTTEDPYLVQWIPNDPRNAMNFSSRRKWSLTILAAASCFAISFASSAYTGGIQDIMTEFEVSNTIALLGVSLFVAGFAIGPLFWAPLSEIYGRQILFLGTFGALTIWNAASAGAHTMPQLIIFRFLAGAFGSSPLTNAGGLIADMFMAGDRGLATSLFACGPFMGPVLGPIAGGFLGEKAGWRWIMALTTILCGILWILCVIFTPETYAPVLLQHRAMALSKRTGKVYMSHLDHPNGSKTLKQAFKVGLCRPWALLFLEPIVLILSVYMAIVYATMYMLFAAYPIIFEKERGWSTGMSGLAFIGIAIGMFIAFGWMVWENQCYKKRARTYSKGIAPPEARLPPCMIGAVLTPIGLFWFAWTNSPSIHWSICLAGTVPFGIGNVLLYLSCMNYLIDSYVIYAASCMAGSSVLRSLLGAAFPLFTSKMYASLGIHWASSVPAFLALTCVPFPFLFHRYGALIRKRCSYASEAQRAVEKLLEARKNDKGLGEI